MRNDLKLAAFCVQRRSIAAAIFVGTHLGFSDVKQLAADREKAKTSAIGFVNWIIESFDIDTAVMERFEGSHDLMKAANDQEVEQALRARDVSIQRVPKSEFVTVFTHPPKASRKDARDIVSNIWPILNSSRPHAAKLDAVALGLYVQTDRLLQ
jgi:hypothetical protein